MYAIFKNGGKQYQAFKGQIILLDKINKSVGEIIDLNEVLVFLNKEKMEIGKPFLKNIIVRASIISHIKNKKIRIIKFNRRKHYRKTQGHRQSLTNIKILNILQI